MKRILYFLLSSFLACALPCVASHLGTGKSTLTRLDEAGHLYILDYKEDYKLDDVISSGIVPVDSLIGFLSVVLNGGMPAPKDSDAGSGCASFRAFTPEGDAMFCRNYDYRHDPVAVVIRTAPENGYRSLGIADAGWLGIKPGGLEAASPMAAFMPYATLDGMNEKGVAISVMELNGYYTFQKAPSKPTVGTSVAIRMVLDKAASVDEAIALLEGCNMRSVKEKSDFHFLIADASGKAVVVEYIGNEMKVLDKGIVANDHLTPGVGAGPASCPRYRTMQAALTHSRDTLSAIDAMNLLSLVRQGGHRGGAPTQWSAVYNLDRLEMDLCVNMEYSDKRHFNL